jgi:hypothetical protein
MENESSILQRQINEREQARGYERQPQTVEEVSEWEAEQVWCEYEPEESE